VTLKVKLEIPIEAMRKLEASLLLRRLPGKEADLVSVYFDNEKLKLRKRGGALQIRQIDGHFLQTAERNEFGNGAALRRDEWETEINDKKLDIEAARRTALKPLLTKKVCRGLKPIFETRVRRTIYPIRYYGSEIEVSIDRGHIEAGHQRLNLHEVELELKQGDSPALFRLAHQIVKDMPAALGVKSKADHGYDLLTGEASRPVRAFSVKLVPKQSSQSALQSIARVCLHQLCANMDPLRTGDAEALHQARVSIRRLRVAISLFSDLLRDKQTEGIKRELKWLTGEFGPAREVDVFMERVVKPVVEADHKTRGVSELRDDVIKSRDADVARAQSAIDTVRFRVLTLAIAAWTETGNWTHSGDAQRDPGDRAIAETAMEQLSRRWKRLVNRGKHIDTLDPRQRHKLRIAAKKLRYASEFFAGIFPGQNAERRRKRFIASLKALQVCLGDLNDIVVNERLSASLVSSPAHEGLDDEVWKAFAAGRLYGREEARASSVMKAAMRAHKVFVEAERFWI
jgi:triphosphatase